MKIHLKTRRLKLSVIILNYKVPHHLLVCLDSVTKACTDIEAEIIVVDNNSEDNSCQLVKKHYPKVKLVENKENLGFSKGNNRGVRVSSGDYLCILNPDTIVPEDCFKNLMQCYENLRSPGAIGVQLIDGTGQFLLESKRNTPTPLIALEKLVGNSSSYYNHKLDKDAEGPTDILVGAFMFLKSDLYKSIGGFDEDYFMYGEDIDLSYRISQAGYQNYYLGTTKVLHFKGESTTKDQEYLNRFFNAMFIFYKKHFKNYKISFSLVKQSLKLTMALEKLKLKSMKNQAKTFQSAYLLSSDTCMLKSVKSQFSTTINMTDCIHTDVYDSMIIADANHIQYKKYIELLSHLKSKNNVFRIKPRNYDFIIGSESKYAKGEVTYLS